MTVPSGMPSVSAADRSGISLEHGDGQSRYAPQRRASDAQDPARIARTGASRDVRAIERGSGPNRSRLSVRIHDGVPTRQRDQLDAGNVRRCARARRRRSDAIDRVDGAVRSRLAPTEEARLVPIEECAERCPDLTLAHDQTRRRHRILEVSANREKGPIGSALSHNRSRRDRSRDRRDRLHDQLDAIYCMSMVAEAPQGGSTGTWD